MLPSGFSPENKTGTFIKDLSGNWQMNATLDDIPLHKEDYRNYSSALYNGMIAPLIHIPVKGIIWYQGEDNASMPFVYHDMFKSMIKDMRKRWKKPDLPFLYVQVSSWLISHHPDEKDQRGDLRIAQEIYLPYTGMAVSYDLGDPYDPHPRNKKLFGERLALQALKVAYQQNVISDGPQYLSHQWINETLILCFDNTLEGLKVNYYEDLEGFHLTDSYSVSILINPYIEDNKVIIPLKPVTFPLVLSYGLGNYSKANLYNSANLPAKPFRVIIE